MHCPILSPTVLCIIPLLLATTASASRSSKRGLVFTPNSTWPQDNYIWTRSPSDLTWYYNYGSMRSPVYNNLSAAEFEFVPMLWGAPSDPSDTTFLSSVKAIINSGYAVSHVMSFNEPDLSTEYGGSNVDPSLAAEVWVSNIIPLQELGVKAGLPACSGSTESVPWLNQFLGNCSQLVSTDGETKNCTYEFVPFHWYGNFDGFASHIGTYAAAFPNTSLWVTEFGYNDQTLEDTQWFFNVSVAYLDNLTYIERYSYFGAFRASVSNVGPNAAMLSDGGMLTDIGVWYLGENGTGVSPESTESPSAADRISSHVPVLSLAASILTSVVFLAIV